MGLGERILIRLSKNPSIDDGKRPTGPDPLSSRTIKDHHSALLHDFGSFFFEAIRGRVVLDLGCGYGNDGWALIEAGARWVAGVDFQEKILPRIHNQKSLAYLCADARTLPFADKTFDAILTKDSMEHFPDPAHVLKECRRILRPGGLIFITFGPLWLSPYGAHVWYFTPIPWVHLLFSERTIMSVRSRFRNDGAKRYEEVEGGLNRMTLRKFYRVIKDAGLQIERIDLYPVKKLVPLTYIPGLREFFTNKVVCVLQKDSPTTG